MVLDSIEKDFFQLVMKSVEMWFAVDMSSSPLIDKKGKDILILGRGPTQGLGEHLLTVEKM